ncbi:MAG: hydroxymethylbilane synthase [Saprospiraceae bacterium]|nr:hydroxymethylbilane synthase [Saprospiraceae bacterium]
MKKVNKSKIRIGTRESALALWQAQLVSNQLNEAGYATELVLIKSEGDIDLRTPLYEMGVQGIFTKTLDVALLANKVDIAVHSLKDVPIQPAKGLRQAAVLKRDSYKDILVFKGEPHFLFDDVAAVIATSSIRRKAQWLNRFPNHHIENLRGNVNTRLQKLSENAWNGAIFAAAGLERLDIRPQNSLDLDWMLPAPAQGAIGVYCRSADEHLMKICHNINDAPTALCTHIERMFLKTLMGGCSAPIAALATLDADIVTFKGCVLSSDGVEKMSIEQYSALPQALSLGQKCAHQLLENGADRLIQMHKDNVAKIKKEQALPCLLKHNALYSFTDAWFEKNLNQFKNPIYQ